MSLSFFLRGRLRWRNQAAAVQSVENSFQVSAAEKKIRYERRKCKRINVLNQLKVNNMSRNQV